MKDLEALRARMTAVHGERRAREAFRRGLLVAVLRLVEAAEARREVAREAMSLALDRFYETEGSVEAAHAMLAGFADDAEEGPGLYRGLGSPVEVPARVRRVVCHGWDENPRTIEFPDVDDNGEPAL